MELKRHGYGINALTWSRFDPARFYHLLRAETWSNPCSRDKISEVVFFGRWYDLCSMEPCSYSDLPHCRRSEYGYPSWAKYSHSHPENYTLKWFRVCTCWLLPFSWKVSEARESNEESLPHLKFVQRKLIASKSSDVFLQNRSKLLDFTLNRVVDKPQELEIFQLLDADKFDVKGFTSEPIIEP